MGNPKLDFQKILKQTIIPERLSSMEVKPLEKGENELYSLRLESIGRRKGFSDIRIRQVGSAITLEDEVCLPPENRGFERDIVLLKKCMYQDTGVVAYKYVNGLTCRRGSEGEILFFKTDNTRAHVALLRYMDVAAEVMSKFFEGYGTIDLAFSMARERFGG